MLCRLLKLCLWKLLAPGRKESIDCKHVVIELSERKDSLYDASVLQMPRYFNTWGVIISCCYTLDRRSSCRDLINVFMPMQCIDNKIVLAVRSYLITSEKLISYESECARCGAIKAIDDTIFQVRA